MKRLSLTIKNTTPFSIAHSRAVGNVQGCLDYIPGTALRGAIASLYLKSNKPNKDFKKVFIDGKVTFCNLYIDGAKPVPLSTYSCKNYGGFLGDREKHGAVDFLLPLIREKVEGIDLPDGLKKCQYHVEGTKTCGIETKRIKGYYLSNPSDGSLIGVTINKRLIYHTAISPVTETALENSLYSQEVMEAGEVFHGDIIIYDDSLYNNVSNLIRSHSILFFGSDKSVGLGRFEIISTQQLNGFNEDSLKERIMKFNETLGIKNGKTYFSITLQSDAIITDKYMRFKTFIDGEDLGINSVHLVCGVAETRMVQGWNAMARLPKEDALAIEKGSVFVFSVDGSADNISNRLFELEVYGIGKRRVEGFGRLTICDSFHLQEGPK